MSSQIINNVYSGNNTINPEKTNIFDFINCPEKIKILNTSV